MMEASNAAIIKDSFSAESNSHFPAPQDFHETTDISNNLTPTTQPHEPEQEPQQQPLSKRAQKRAAKAAYLQEKKHERRQRERAAKKEKRRVLKERREAGDLDGDSEELKTGEPARKKPRQNADEDIRPFKAKVVVDLGFDSYMTDKINALIEGLQEIVSLSSQLAYCYSVNRRASCPFETLLFTSLDGRLHARLERENNAGYKRWTGCEWWEEGYERLWTDESPNLGTHQPEEGVNIVEAKETLVAKVPSEDKEKARSRSSRDAVVYLTADANEELEEMKEGETYILGGIVDHNRHKNLCQNKAAAQGIRTAQLPIGKYLKELKTRKVLTVNQVFEILVRWAENRNWEDALYGVIPKRKFTQSQQTTKPQVKKADDRAELKEVEANMEGEDRSDDDRSEESAEEEKGNHLESTI